MTITSFALCASLALTSCATADIPEFNTYVTLPASGDGYAIGSISHKEKRIPKAEWEKKRRAGIVLLAEDYAKIRFSLLKNCITGPCTQTVGALDGLFAAIDEALKAMPK